MTVSQREDDVIANNDDRHKASTIPLVRLTLKNITYKPVVKTYSSSSIFRHCTKSLFQSKTRKNDDVVLKENRGQKKHKTVRKVILKNVSPPPVEPYTVQGWMGPSGMRAKY